MKLLAVKLFWVVLLGPFLAMPQGLLAAQQPQGSQPIGVKEKQPPPVPGLADLIPLETKLSARLAVLQKKVGTELDASPVEKGLSGIDAKLAEHSRELENLKASTSYSYEQLLVIREKIRRDGEALDEVIKPLTEATRKFAQARQTWLEERQQWTAWQSVMLTDQPLDELKNTFARSQITIDSALVLINQQLQPLLALLQRAGAIDGAIDALIAEINGLTVTLHRDIQPDAAPSMVSLRYVSQLRNQAWYELKGGMRALFWPEWEFFQTQGWLFVLQLLLATAVTMIIFRHRSRLVASERWRFLARRPVAAGIFLGFVLLNQLYEAPPLSWFFFMGVIAGISGARLLSGLLTKPWQRTLIYALIGFLITTRFLGVIGLPHPIFRLYIVLAALVGLGLCWWASVQTSSSLYDWVYRGGSLFFVVMLIAELGAYSSFAEYLMRSSLYTLGATLLTWLLIYIVRGGMEGLIYHTPLQRIPLVRSNPAEAVRRLSRLTDVLIITLYLALILVGWRVYPDPAEAVKGVLSLGVTVGSLKITLGHLLSAAVVLYGSFLLSWAIRNLLMGGVLAKSKADAGTQHSITALVHYILVFLGFLLALSVLGFHLTQLTIMLSALGVGIGFGLQQVVNNFVCGLIMLFERPVKIGDFLEMGGHWVEVKKIGLRATTVRTLDHAEIVVPNSDLITSQVTNWTLTDRRVRLIIPVGVAYGSDVPLVIETLLKCADAHTKVLKRPEPQILFRSFGESSLDFEMRFYILNPDERLQIISDLHQEIDREFRLAGIEIAFPQRDLHLRSVDDLAGSRLHLPEDQPLQLLSGGDKDKESQ
jgi:potassium efflux system protein